MLIGNRYAENKLYRGIKHYDSLPLTSGDIHEFTDTLYQKYAHLFNNILGSGNLNAPVCTISNTNGISLEEPIVTLVDGDIVLIYSDDPIVSKSEIQSAGFTNGLVCAVGWYQSITAASTLREYGGVQNSTLENDIPDPKLDIQVSTRYQLRWDIVILNKSTYTKHSAFNITIKNRDETGELTSGTTTLRTTPYSGEVHKATKPASMSYADSDLYVVPLLEYTYSNNSISSVKVHQSVRLSSSTEYTSENEVIINASVDTPTNIDVNIGISEFEEENLKVLYNGIPLEKGEHYIVDYTNKKIVLLNFRVRESDRITFLA